MLTPRQKQVAMLLAKGLNNHEVAAEMNINIKTVDTHRQAVLKRLGLRGNVDLAHYAIAHNWVEVKFVTPQEQS